MGKYVIDFRIEVDHDSSRRLGVVVAGVLATAEEGVEVVSLSALYVPEHHGIGAPDPDLSEHPADDGPADDGAATDDPRDYSAGVPSFDADAATDVPTG